MTKSVGNMRAITIAQVHGFAIGGALLLMLDCDFRIVGEDTFFSIPEVDLGIPLSWGGIPKLVAEIGPCKTKELVMTCRRFYPAEAKSLGLINQIVVRDSLADVCLNLAKELAQKPVAPIMITKKQVHAAGKRLSDEYIASSETEMMQNILNDDEFYKTAKAYLTKNMKKG